MIRALGGHPPPTKGPMTRVVLIGGVPTFVCNGKAVRRPAFESYRYNTYRNTPGRIRTCDLRFRKPTKTPFLAHYRRACAILGGLEGPWYARRGPFLSSIKRHEQPIWCKVKPDHLLSTSSTGHRGSEAMVLFGLYALWL